MTQRPRANGFTTIELLVAVVVVGILTAVALPSFLDSIRKGRRSEAFSAIAAVQQKNERWRSSNAQYSTSLDSTHLDFPSTTPTGYYTITVAGSGATGDTLDNAYTVSAIAVSGTSQANDTQCSSLSSRVRAGVVEYAGCAGCSTFSYAATNACWSR